MGHNEAGNPALFPISAFQPDDGDDITASNLNPGAQVSLSRAAFLARRTLPGGVQTADAATLGALAALTGLPLNDIRHVPGYGWYRFMPTGTFGSPTNPADGNYVVNGVGGVWVHVDASLQNMRLIQQDNEHYLGAPVLANAAGDVTDPTGRVGGTPAKRLLTTSSFTIFNGDLLDIEYRAPFYLYNGASNAVSDVVVAVGMTGASTFYFDEGLIAREFQHTGSQNNGFALGYLGGSGVPVRYTFAGGMRRLITGGDVGGGVTRAFSLVFCCSGETDGQFIQSASLSVTQYRPVIT